MKCERVLENKVTATAFMKRGLTLSSNILCVVVKSKQSWLLENMLALCRNSVLRYVFLTLFVI